MDELMDALSRTGLQFALYAWDRAPKDDYGVISLSEGNDLIADGVHCERGTEGFVDFFTRDTTNYPRTLIESVLNGLCAFYLNSVQYEEDTHYIHYEWKWSMHG